MREAMKTARARLVAVRAEVEAAAAEFGFPYGVHLDQAMQAVDADLLAASVAAAAADGPRPSPPRDGRDGRGAAGRTPACDVRRPGGCPPPGRADPPPAPPREVGMSSVDSGVYVRPSPVAVARLYESHGAEAALARWHWLNERTLGAMARNGRAAQGQAHLLNRLRGYSDLDAAVCIEAAHALGSGRRGERAAGVTLNPVGTIFATRGLPPVAVSKEERGRATRLGHAANKRDLEAVAARAAQHALEAAVGSVLRKALAMVPDQPSTGRYLLPAVTDALREVLAGEPADAIALVFPDLAQEPAAMIQPSVIAKPAQAHRRVPADEVIIADHAKGGTPVGIAMRYGVRPQSLYAHWRRLELSRRRRLAGFDPGRKAKGDPEPSVEEAPVVREVPPPAVVDVPHQVVTSTPHPFDQVPGRLGVADLALAVRLSREENLEPAVALAWIRADIAASRRSA
ncbi:hypothetical protein [Methylobacterium sp. J-070]|uniref:hypothetical protein n=1 Tax=Methylobacterium sp. J-070 TaxID=2836650 RepID=UPI001FB8E768|nr:hypothetical protein [Methylobacterium sp. J-070]MCJ2048796.1 hypothetical protein [Methylobacterium sp. J-070]